MVTVLPAAARAQARLTETVLLPVPPLRFPTAMTRPCFSRGRSPYLMSWFTARPPAARPAPQQTDASGYKPLWLQPAWYLRAYRFTRPRATAEKPRRPARVRNADRLR